MLSEMQLPGYLGRSHEHYSDIKPIKKTPSADRAVCHTSHNLSLLGVWMSIHLSVLIWMWSTPVDILSTS